MSLTKEIYSLLKNAQQKKLLFSQPDLQFQGDVENIGYYPDGQEHFHYTFHNGKLHGVGHLWHENGRVKREDPYHKGVLHGCQRHWDADGHLLKEIHYFNGAYHGQRREWYASGQQYLECTYTMNALEGIWTRWYQNGLIKERVEYQDGECHGLWKEFNEKGKMIICEFYMNGTRLPGRVQRLITSGRLTAKQILRMSNPLIRRRCLREFGYERFLKVLPHEVLDREGDYELIRLDWHKEEEPLCLVKVRCPSTGVYYALRVPPQIITVNAAVAWTFGLTEKDYQPDEET